MSQGRCWCPWRRRWLQAQPEECVRQKLLCRLVEELGFPAAGIAVERALAALPYLAEMEGALPRRRADVLCFGGGGRGYLFPLLLIECKAVPLNRRMLDQVVGYNYYLKAAFVALVNQQEAQTGWFDPIVGNYQFVKGLPSYEQLLARRCSDAQLLRSSRNDDEAAGEPSPS